MSETTKWYWPFSQKSTASSSNVQESVTANQQQDRLDEAATKIDALTKEIESIKEHGTTDPMLLAQARALSESIKANSFQRDYRAAAAYGAIYTKVADSRTKVIKEVDRMRYFYLVDVIINQFVEDALAPEVGSGNILEVSSTREDLQREIDLIEEKFDLDQLALTVAPDVVAYGEYTLATQVNPKVAQKPEKFAEEIVNVTTNPTTVASKGATVSPPLDTTLVQRGVNNKENPPSSSIDDGFGLVDILDTVEQGTVVALTKYSNITGYLVRTGDGKVKKQSAADYVKFAASSQRVRIDLAKEFNMDMQSKRIPDELKDVQRYIRVGRSFIHPILSKLKELELLEAMVPATKLAKLSNGTVIGVQVPSGYDIQKGMEAARHVEGVLNKRVGVDEKLGELTIENIMNTAGRTKVVPIFGDKGQLSKLDYQSDEPDELLSSIKEIRDIICSSVGLPYELVFSSDTDMSKGAILKKYARYLRKLKALQKTIEEGIRQIVYIHLVNKGYKFSSEEIKVEFYNKLIEIDNLDKLEFMDTIVGLLKNAKDFISDLANPELNPKYADKVNVGVFMEYINTQLGVIGLNNLIDVRNQEVVGTTIVKKQTGENPSRMGLKATTQEPKDLTIANLISTDNEGDKQ